VPPGIEIQGDLILKGGKTTLDLFSNEFFVSVLQSQLSYRV